MAVDISTWIGGVKMRSPLGVASYLPVQSPWYPETPIEYMKEKLFQKWFDNGVGFVKCGTIVNTKGASYKPSRHCPIIRVAPGVEGCYNFLVTSGSSFGPSESLPMLEALKEMASKYQDVAVIGSIAAPTCAPEPWVEIAKVVEGRGVDLIELNTCSPISHFGEWSEVLAPEDAKFGSRIGCEPKIVGRIVEAVVKAVKTPVGVKLTADAGYPGILRVLNVCNEAGAKYVDMFHSVVTVAPPDIYNGGRALYPNTNGWNAWGLMLGEYNIPHLFKGAVLTSINFPKLEIFAGGGINKPQQVIQSIMLGARAVETMSAIFFHGNSFISKSLNFLKNYMEKQGYRTLDDFRGVGIQYIKSPLEEFEKVRHLKFKVETDMAKCSGCGLCAENFCPASYMEDNIGKVDPGRCNGCSLCVMFCPSGARRMVLGD